MKDEVHSPIHGVHDCANEANRNSYDALEKYQVRSAKEWSMDCAAINPPAGPTQQYTLTVE